MDLRYAILEDRRPKKTVQKIIMRPIGQCCVGQCCEFPNGRRFTYFFRLLYEI